MAKAQSWRAIIAGKVITTMWVGSAIASQTLAGLCDAGLQSPFPQRERVVVGVPEQYECEWAPNPIVTLDAQSKYDQNDPDKAALDQAAAEAFEAEMADLRAYRTLLIQAANTAVRKPKLAQSARDCATGYLMSWVQADALSDMQSHTANQHRATYLAAMALAWLQIRDHVLHTDHHAEIEAWMARRAADTITYFEGREGKTSTLNNHRYWAGMAVAASAIVSGNCDHYAWGVGALDVAAAQITDDGYLPLELERGKRARDYHLYAMGPLMMLAYMEHAQGRDVLAAHDGALRRLAAQTVAALADPAPIEALTQKPQNPFKGDGALPQSHQIAWMELVQRMDASLLAGVDLDVLKPFSFSSLGGNLTMLLEETGDT